MSDSENRQKHLQSGYDITNESPGYIEHTGGDSEVTEDQSAHGEENNILEDKHGHMRKDREDPNSDICFQEDLASNIGRLEDPLRNILPNHHQFEEDQTRREARFSMSTQDPFRTLGVQEDSVRPEEPFHVHSDDQSRYRWKQEDSWPQNTNFARHCGNFSERDNWLPMHHQMEQFMNWRSGQRGDATVNEI